MKTLLTLFVLLFSSSVISEDISDFEIEGISIGDSLLSFMSEEEIKNEIEYNLRDYKYLNNPKLFREVYMRKKKGLYDQLSFFIKSNNSNYKIYFVRGMINYEEELEACLNKKKEIIDIITKDTTKLKTNDVTSILPLDSSGKSITYATNLIFKNGDKISVTCSNWEENFRKENNYTEGLSVILSKGEVMDWLSDY